MADWLIELGRQTFGNGIHSSPWLSILKVVIHSNEIAALRPRAYSDES